MKLLITGASGFIGSTLVDEGMRQNFQVWAGMRKSSSKAYLQYAKLNFIELDFSNKERLIQQLSHYSADYGKWDYIIHCAGATKCLHPNDFNAINFEGTRNFVEALQALNMVPLRFIYLSSLSIMGAIREKDMDSLITADDTPQPNTAYGKSKLKAEEFIKKQADFPYVIFRPTGVYGPREKDYFLMAKSIQKHVDFAVGYKKQILTFVYVQDLVKAIFLAIEKKVVKRCYFVSDGSSYSSRSFSDYIQKELGTSCVIHVKAPLFLLKVISLCAEKISALFHKSSTLNRDKYNIMKQRNWQCDITPLIKELGYKADYDLEKGVKTMIAWYKNEKWL